MEQDCITGVYQSLGLSVGEKFSTEDVSHLYCKVFHVPSDIEEAHMAMMKIAGSDNSWSCVGENVLDVLLEMAREREKKEKQYWDLQLLNMGNHLSILHRMDTTLIADPHMLHQKDTELNIFRAAHNQTGSLQSRTIDTKSSQWERWLAKKGMQWSVRDVKRLKRAHRQCWARLVVEGIQSILPSPLPGQEVGGHAWGAVSLSDVLLLVEVKYDVVTHLLYTEMLQEHYTLTVWENLLPWQQRKAEEGLGDLAEEALESGDVLGLAELPGAFKIYRLNRESLRLLCLYIRLATLKAQREKLSYSALLAARQSWETWPYVNSPLRAEQAALWLQSEDKEPKKLISVLPKQTVLQLLVLTQEQERKNLVKLVHGVSLGNLQDPGCTEAPKEETSPKDAALRNGCIKRLQQIHASLKTNNDAQNPRLEDCAQLLLVHLMELQDVQTSVLLPALMDKSTQRVQALRDECVSELQGQHLTNLFQLLTSDTPLGSFSTQMPNSNTTQNSNNDQMAAQSSCAKEARAQNISATDTEAADSVRGARVQAADGADVQDVCTGCGVFMEDLPYLEILCVSDATHNTQREGGAEEVEEVGATTNPQSYEKQGSLITLAWSKPLDDDNNCGAEAAAGSTTQSQFDEGDRKSEVQPGDLSDTAEHTLGEETLVQPDLAGDTQSASQQCSSEKQLTLTERPVTEQSATGEHVSDCEVPVHASAVDNQQDTQPALLIGSEDFCSGTSSETGDVNTTAGDTVTDSEVWDLSGPELDTAFYSSSSERDVMRESTLRERPRETVSAVERERTMRCLVDMQKKVEQRQQRDKKRQLLRVQERLSIIQNRKAEEDLLGLKHTDRLKHLTQDLPQEDKTQQKTVVKERLEQLRRERSYIMQSKRDRNTAGFKELLGPVAQQSRETEDDTDRDITPVDN
ncbi:uncharacterized protein LOC115421035 [Sphaeramia orbicularis]|uniref:uncharacterized protein LOC115421035 n=1 Tax=Sphaeramia orbicularis TaxID=375764 RepID=UPI001180FEFC|nr:uncharacterized protein LOC115421035 [Sphaeramia orbicularis]